MLGLTGRTCAHAQLRLILLQSQNVFADIVKSAKPLTHRPEQRTTLEYGWTTRTPIQMGAPPKGDIEGSNMRGRLFHKE